MCGTGSRCPRCGEHESMYGPDPRGCALPWRARSAIYYCGLPVGIVEAAIAAAEDKALEDLGAERLRELRREDARVRAQEDAARTNAGPPPIVFGPGNVVVAASPPGVWTVALPTTAPGFTTPGGTT